MRNLGVCGLLLSIWGALACSTFPGGSGESKTTREPSASDVATYPAGGNGHRPSSGGKSALQAADTAAPATLDLESVIRRAASENPAVKSAWHRWKASTQKRAQEVSLPDPRVEGTIFNPKDTEKWMMGLNQEIPWPGKLILAGRIADEQARIEALGYVAAIRDAVADAKETYFELYYIDHAEAVTGEIQKLYDRYAALAAGNQESGRSKLPELFRAESQRAQLGYDLVLLREMRRAEEEKLRAAIGADAGTPIGRAQEVDDPTTLTLDLDALNKIAEANNQELAQAGISVAKSHTERRLARQAAAPDFMLGLRYTEMVDAPGMAIQNPVGFTAGFSVPLWFGKYRAKAEEARQMEAEAQSEEDRARLKLRADVAEAFFRLNNAFRLVRLYRDTLIPQARQAQQSAEELYGRREANLAALIETLSTVHNFELARLRATADYYQNASRMERLAGIALPAVQEARP